MNLIDRYVGKSVFITALYGVVVLSVVLVLGNIFKELLDLLINRDVPLKYVLLFMLYVLPFSLTFTVPWGFLTAVLLIFGRMSADNEMIALRACGVSLLRICLPVLAVGILLSLFTFWINAVVAPQAEMAMRQSVATMARSNPAALFVPDEVVDQFQGKKIFVGGKEGGKLTDLTVIEQADGGYISQVIHAKRGEIESDEASGELTLTLEETRFEQRNADNVNDLAAIRHGISVSEATINIPLDDLVENKLRRRSLRSYTLDELYGRLEEVRGTDDETSTLTQISKRYSLSLACVAFALIAMPLGVTAQRKETSVGFAISLALAFAYFFFVVLADMLRHDAVAFPYLLLWIPNILFIGIGTWLMLRLDYR
ncbi:MAG: LptF/LptG family permease [Chthoniobacterales bacterium]